ncbi:uncharacterized protein AB9X84_024043 [Acanthopagrus schlegelii]
MKNFIFLVFGLLPFPQQAQSRTDCRPMTANFCQGLGYTTTPNPTGAIGYNLHQISQMVETGCSPHVATVLCRVAVPECGSDDDSRLKPCRALCQKVKTDCDSAFKAKRLYWPTRLRCESLPESNCIQGQVAPVQPQINHSPSLPVSTCQPITVPLCKNLAYTETAMPNVLGHTLQADANLQIQTFAPLIQVGCSPHLTQFLCSVYTPECVEGRPQPPCRTLCETVKSSCEPVLNRHELLWPEALKCEAFTTASCKDIPAPPVPQFSFVTKPPATCELITVPLCQDLPYIDTAMPNILGHNSQEDAGLEVHQFTPLIKVGCSSHLKPFLCSVYTPECTSGKLRPPCRTLCEQARAGCETLMNKFGFPWPNALSCDKFSTESCEHYGVSSSGGICEPITIPVCQGLPYNQTIMPNLLGHANQREAVVKMSFFNSIVQAVCSVDIRLFVCMVYAPRCVAGEVQRPCKSFCQRAKTGCEELTNRFGVSWPNELLCDSFPDENCISEESRLEMLSAEGVRAKLDAGGFSVRGKSLSLKTARLLLTLMDADGSGDLDVVEVFKLEHYVAVVRREYVESYERRNPPAVTQNQMKKILSARGFDLDDKTFRTLWQDYQSTGGIDYDEFVAVLTKLQILRDRFQAHLMSVPCDCEVASFSFKQFMKSTII